MIELHDKALRLMKSMSNSIDVMKSNGLDASDIIADYHLLGDFDSAFMSDEIDKCRRSFGEKFNETIKMINNKYYGVGR